MPTFVPWGKCNDTVEKETDIETHLKSLNRTTKHILDSLASTSSVKYGVECDFVTTATANLRLHTAHPRKPQSKLRNPSLFEKLVQYD